MLPEVTVMSKYAKDLAERVVFTAAEAGVGVLAVAAAGWPTAYAIPIATALATLKAGLAKLVGNTDSASLAKTV